MRFYSNAYELMSETGRNLVEMGHIVKPKTYQNKRIEGNEEMITREMICEQYCLTELPDPEWLFVYTKAKDWADKEFEERVNHVVKYRGQIMSKLEAIIKLLQEDNDTRKAVLNIFGEASYNHSKGQGDTNYCDSNHYDGSARIPCSMYYDFLVRENAGGEKVLHIAYHQRSSDFIQHFGDDVYLAWKLMEYVAERIDIKPGYLFHTIDSLHSYKKDWWMLKTSINDIK